MTIPLTYNCLPMLEFREYQYISKILWENDCVVSAFWPSELCEDNSSHTGLERIGTSCRIKIISIYLYEYSPHTLNTLKYDGFRTFLSSLSRSVPGQLLDYQNWFFRELTQLYALSLDWTRKQRQNSCLLRCKVWMWRCLCSRACSPHVCKRWATRWHQIRTRRE